MDLTPHGVTALAERVAGTGAALRELGADRRVAALARAAALLADPSTGLGRQARSGLPETTGLSPEMVAWALETSLGTLTEGALCDVIGQALAAGAPRRPVPPRLATVILAGNVFTAALNPVAFALGLGAPVVAKASSREDRFPRLLAAALEEADGEVAESFEVVTFPGGTTALETPLFAASDAVVAYGGDDTIRDLRSRVPATARLLEHGHGVGVAFVGAEALASEEAARRAADGLALDVAAYDQRGCLSPVAAWVEDGVGIDVRAFGELLGQALDGIEQRLPRGPLPSAVAAAEMQWRGVAAARGWLREGAKSSLALLEDGEAPPLGSPGWRNLTVLSCPGLESFAATVGRLGVHLKAVGVAGGADLPNCLAPLLPPPACPRISAVGTLQTPPLGVAADGALPAVDLLRWTA